jgi:arsenate reductase (thioredoxin)
MTEQVFNVLILCTGNSARSIMAEALFNTVGKGRFKAYSAGSFPNGKVNPYAIEMIQATGYPSASLRSKSWDEFTVSGAPHMDFVITVCDNAANEICPVWPGSPITAHWGFEDPAALEATDEEKRTMFRKIFHQIRRRVDIFSQLPLTNLSKLAIKHEMDKIGEMENPSE